MHEEYKYSLSLIAVIGRESGLLDPQNANESLYSCFHAVKSLSLTFFCLSPICSGLAKITSTVVTHGAVFGHYGEQYGVSCMASTGVSKSGLIFKSLKTCTEELASEFEKQTCLCSLQVSNMWFTASN